MSAALAKMLVARSQYGVCGALAGGVWGALVAGLKPPHPGPPLTAPDRLPTTAMAGLDPSA